MEAVSWLPAWLELEVLGRLLLALALGAMVGIERELRGKPAGLRTLILIAVGAEIFTEASLIAASQQLHDLVRADPARIAAQIVSGIGFIGAGTILVHRGNVVGITTAASIWVAAAVGMMVGLRAYVIAVGGTVLVLLTLTLLGWIEARWFDRETVNLRIGLERDCEDHAWLSEFLERRGLTARALELVRNDDGEVEVTYRIHGMRRDQHDLTERLFEDPRVRTVAVK